MAQPTRMMSAEILRVIKDREADAFRRYLDLRQKQRVRGDEIRSGYADVPPSEQEVELGRVRWEKSRDDLDRAIERVMEQAAPV